MEILNRREQIGAKKLPPVIGEDVEKAGKSKYGVVKVGDGINVSNGVISVPAASGFTVDELWTGNVTSDYKNITSELVHPITDYKFLIVSWKSGVNVQSGQLLYVPNMSADGNNSNYLQFGTNNINIRLGSDTVSIGGGTYNNMKLLGIK